MTFYLGNSVGDEGSGPSDAHFAYDPSDLTTHGVIVGMTGSGKTGLGVIYLEEALRAQIPTLVIDPKGDMTNLLLTFPDLAPSDFAPWVDAGAAEKEGKTVEEEAEAEATKWREGLGRSGLTGDDIGAMRSTTGMTIYTPGSEAANPINIIGDLAPPPLSWETDAEALRAEIQGFTSGLLGLVDIDADPVSSREHILIDNLVERAWRADTALDLGSLISQIAQPPMRKLGVFEVDQFFPEKDRMALAMRLNGLLASPSFGAWMTGAPLDIEAMLWRDGKPQAAVIYIAHLSESERQFVVTMILSKLLTWMRSQPGSTDLRALVYMDEVFGFVPPTAEPPSKRPILTLLKQARAFGVGLLLSTQNPVDLDYKAMSNAGTWCIGRLQTARDKARIIEALTTASGDVDTAAIDATISNLPKRTFVLHSTRSKTPGTFSTRWAMSYLRGPMTRDEVGRFKKPSQKSAVRSQKSEGEPAAAAGAATEITQPVTEGPPAVAEGIDSAAIHPAAPWRPVVQDKEHGDCYEAVLAVAVSVRFDDTRAGIDHTETWEAILPTLDASDPSAIIEVDHDERDFVDPDPNIRFIEPDAPISNSSFFTSVSSDIKQYLDREETLELFKNRPLKLVSRPGETREAFRERCRIAAVEGSDSEKAKIANRFSARIRKARRAYDDAVAAADLATQAAQDQTRDDLIGFGLDLLTGRKPRTSRSRTVQNKARTAANKIEDKRRAMEDLDAEVEDLCIAAAEEWRMKIDEIEAFSIGLESDDISVDQIRVVWVRR